MIGRAFFFIGGLFWFARGPLQASDMMTLRVIWYDDQGSYSRGSRKSIKVKKACSYTDAIGAMRSVFAVPRERKEFSLITTGHTMAAVDPAKYKASDLQRALFVYFFTA